MPDQTPTEQEMAAAIEYAHEQPNFAGMEIEEGSDQHGNQFAFCCIVFSSDRPPLKITEYMPDLSVGEWRDEWHSSPIKMLRREAVMQAIIYAFAYKRPATQHEPETS